VRSAEDLAPALTAAFLRPRSGACVEVGKATDRFLEAVLA
jgi:hypothetical protein